MKIEVTYLDTSYPIIIEENSLDKINDYFDVRGKVCIITDSLVPVEYAQMIKKSLISANHETYIYTFPAGEINKSILTYQSIMNYLIEIKMTRTDTLIAVGGGVTGDMTGFVASTFMRGIRFYNIPTTTLAMVDSSIGGKTAIDFGKVKNIIGSFYPPYGVLVDSSTIKTLSKRLICEGFVEALKMALTSSIELFNYMINDEQNFNNPSYEYRQKVITSSLLIKKEIVEKDPKEKNLRKLLNFGHTIGHAIESASNNSLLHGECVALGMLYMVSDEIRDKLINFYKKFDLPFTHNISNDVLEGYILHDKKAKGDMISVVFVDNIGEGKIKDIKISEIKNILERVKL